jgi:uncharacterized protein YdaU (DUF1376 family)
MAAIPFMPLYVADYMSDAAHLSTLEHGAYLLLIMTYWQRGEPLPNDDKKLARICRLTPLQWKRIKPQILEFFDVAVLQLSHSRIERELSNVRAKSLNKRKGGLARAEQMHSNRLAPAKQSDTDADTEEPLAKAKGAAPASEKVFWDKAKSHIGGSNPGAIIGKWKRDFGLAETKAAICASQIEGAIDPVSFITAVLRRNNGGGKVVAIGI